MIKSSKTPEGKQEIDPWLGTDETYTKDICGKKVTFRKKPATKHFKVSKSLPSDPDEQNYLLVSGIIVEPEITLDYWKKLWIRVKTDIIAEVGMITGSELSFPDKE